MDMNHLQALQKSGAENTKPTLYERAPWLGHEILWPIWCLLNAGLWTPRQKSQYKEAYNQQLEACAEARSLVTKEQAELLGTWIGMCAPRYNEEAYKEYDGVDMLRAEIKREKNAFCSHLVAMQTDKANVSRKKIKDLLRYYNQAIEAFANTNSESIKREGVHVFFINASSRKRKAEGVSADPVCNPCTPQFWLADRNMKILESLKDLPAQDAW